ncbi:hypothetical protein KPATCC21470_1001 [Kitasatospora purpeofusca]
MTAERRSPLDRTGTIQVQVHTSFNDLSYHQRTFTTGLFADHKVWSPQPDGRSESPAMTPAPLL